MTAYADLEIGLHHHDETRYRVAVTLRLPDEDAERRHQDLVPSFDLEALRAVADDLAWYGQALSNSLFGSEALKTFFAQARAVMGFQGLGLRLRLNVGPALPELHDLRWEVLLDPQHPDAVLSTDERVLFSRYLSSQDWRPVRLQPRGDLKALVVVANPVNLGQYRGQDGAPLAKVEVAGEWDRARQGLGTIPATGLCSEKDLGCSGRPTLGELLRHLRDGYDILYLVCHGVLRDDGQALLYLEDGKGMADVIPASEEVLPDGRRRPGLIAELSQMGQLPRLVVLASCQSGGQGKEWSSPDPRALMALGPRLAEIGIPAVVAMQGNVTMATVEQLMPIFFEELQRDGQIDRAMAAARRAVRDRWDWWVPVLFSRLESGRLFAPEPRAAPGIASAPAPAGPAETVSYDVRAVEDLLQAAFTAEDLRRLVYYSSNDELRQLANRFGRRDGLVDMVLTTIEYCEKRGLLPELLAAVERENPRQYSRFRHRLQG
jgi:hypothetical protein